MGSFKIKHLACGGLITNYFCTEIRTFLMQNDYRGSNELNPKEFYKA